MASEGPELKSLRIRLIYAASIESKNLIGLQFIESGKKSGYQDKSAINYSEGSLNKTTNIGSDSVNETIVYQEALNTQHVKKVDAFAICIVMDFANAIDMAKASYNEVKKHYPDIPVVFFGINIYGEEKVTDSDIHRLAESFDCPYSISSNGINLSQLSQLAYNAVYPYLDRDIYNYNKNVENIIERSYEEIQRKVRQSSVEKEQNYDLMSDFKAIDMLRIRFILQSNIIKNREIIDIKKILEMDDMKACMTELNRPVSWWELLFGRRDFVYFINVLKSIEALSKPNELSQNSRPAPITMAKDFEKSREKEEQKEKKSPDFSSSSNRPK